MRRATGWDEDLPPEDFPPISDGWAWGEIYVWGGVTWVPGNGGGGGSDGRVPMDAGAGDAAPEGASPSLRRKVWAFVKEQYPVASRGGRFAGAPVSPALAASRFEQLANVLRISGEEALELVAIDATPLLVEADGVADAFVSIAEASSTGKALELVRRHPGLLVGGGQCLKAGGSFVTQALVDVLYAGRLLRVLKDKTTTNKYKIAEIEFYAWVAACFKPVMDLIQRRTDDLSEFVFAAFVIFLQVAVLANLFLHAWNPHFTDSSIVAFILSCATWTTGVVSWGLGYGYAGLWFCCCVLAYASWTLGVASEGAAALGPTLAPALDPQAQMTLIALPWVLVLGSWLTYFGAWATSKALYVVTMLATMCGLLGVCPSE